MAKSTNAGRSHRFVWSRNDYVGNSAEGRDHDIVNEIAAAAAAIGISAQDVRDMCNDEGKYLVNGKVVEVGVKYGRRDEFTQKVTFTIVVK